MIVSLATQLKTRKQLRKCVKAHLLHNMKFVENEGTVKIKLDENGDAYARWRIYQNQNGRSVLVASYDETEEPKLQLFPNNINWTVFNHFSTQVLTIDSQNITTTESVCSKPCKAKEYLIQQELQCCWICRKCLVNEYIVNGTSCKACPFGQWPDKDTATYCIIIDTTYLKWSSWITLLLTGITTIGFLFTVYTKVFLHSEATRKNYQSHNKRTMFHNISWHIIGISNCFILFLQANLLDMSNKQTWI